MDRTEEETKRFYKFLRERTPIVLDGWLRVGKNEQGDYWFVHECVRGPQLGTINVTSGKHHKLVSEDPLHIEPSVACGEKECTVHGFIRGGKWISC